MNRNTGAAPLSTLIVISMCENSNRQSAFGTKTAEEALEKNDDRDDEVLHTCSPQQCVISAETVIKIRDLLAMISLNEPFRGTWLRASERCDIRFS